MGMKVRTMQHQEVQSFDSRGEQLARAQFVVYSIPRTGSSHLASLLDSAPDIICHGELFKQNKVQLRQPYCEKIPAFAIRNRSNRPSAYLKRLRALTPECHFGFKLFRQHVIKSKRLESIIRNPNWKKIALIRDPLEVYASTLRALATGIFQKRRVTEPSASNQPLKVKFSRETFEPFAKRYTLYVREVLAHCDNPAWLIVLYEQLNDASQQQEILEFLGSTARASGLRSEFERLNEGSAADAFDNWDEIAEYLSLKDPFEHLKFQSRTLRSTDWSIQVLT